VLRSPLCREDPVQKYKSHCEATLKMIRGKGKLLILHALTDRTLRYSEIARRNTSISESLLVRQLRELEQDGLVTRTIYPEVPPRVEYALTASGKKLVPIDQTDEFMEHHVHRPGHRREPAPHHPGLQEE
jgi:DNA-binding HxlR family transcriptional regulator